MQSIRAMSGSAAFILGSKPQSSIATSASQPIEHLAAKEGGEDADGGG